MEKIRNNQNNNNMNKLHNKNKLMIGEPYYCNKQ